MSEYGHVPNDELSASYGERDAATALEVAAETNKSKPMFVPIFICKKEIRGLYPFRTV